MKYQIKLPKKIELVYTPPFTNDIRRFVKRGSLHPADLEDFKRLLTEDPQLGVIVQGTGGLRKARLKSASSGKRGGFRVCYYYYIIHGQIILLAVYAKNEQDDLSPNERRKFKDIIEKINQETTHE